MSPSGWVVLAGAALSGFFSLCSFSLQSLRRVQLEEAFGAGKGGSRRLEQFDKHLSALRLTAFFCSSVSNLAVVAGMVYLLGMDGWAGAVWAVVAAGAIIAVVAVAIPYAWASYNGEAVLAAVFRILLALRYALFPIVALMLAFDVPIRRLCGADGDELENGDAAKQEILQVASEGQAEGSVEAEEVEMIESVMELGDSHAGEIMTPRTDIIALSVETSWQQARKQTVAAGHSRVPVYEGNLDHITGILYAKDLLQLADDNKDADLRSIMRKPFFVPETKPLDDLLREFRSRKVHIAVVLDEYGGTAGLVTIEDVLEEIVGEITDEYDQAEPEMITRRDKKTAEIDGRLYIDDLNDALGLAIPEDEGYDTAAGFVFSQLGYIPAVGEELISHGAKFTVLDADERKISRLRVKSLSE